ncbi:MFS transporter [Reichenbachiella ulvae]|uniref:MFS transporter n=1 Tax=Reichenbachiella ulvae TaxID=2980104 RepID=A0ABT3CXN9_9BACT|nr:MFS transporter [Reichenbachiella ulvae]MCV9388452.1 MFS transporter [Reichenbachiella ulvae]
MINHKKLGNWPFHPKKWPFFYGWMIIISGTIGISMSIPGQTMGVSTFTDSLIEVMSMSRSQLSFAYMCGTILSASMLTWVGKKYDIHGARPVALIATVGLGMVLVYLSQVNHIQSFFGADGNSVMLNFVIMCFGFFALRFSGQGALTLVSRNMMMKWFEKRRGFAMGFSNVVTSLTFASAPVFFEHLIQRFDWNGAWLVLAVITGLGFPLYIIFFFRDDPENSGLKPDGGFVESKKRAKKNLFPVVKDFTLTEAQKTVGFWVFSMMLAMQALYWTGVTFNIVSLFEHSGYDRETAVSIFLPSSMIAIAVTLSVSSLSDHIKLKNLLYVMGGSACLALLGFIYLEPLDRLFQLVIFGYEMRLGLHSIILGNGVMMGLYSVILSVTWPRFFGRSHLGEISGRAITFVVVGSAVGPILFSESLAYFDSYEGAEWICLVLFAGLTIASIWANNPQEKLRVE